MTRERDPDFGDDGREIDHDLRCEAIDERRARLHAGHRCDGPLFCDVCEGFDE